MAECPFSWTQQTEGCLASQKVWKPVACRGSACQLWAGDDCVFNRINEKLSRKSD